MTNHNGANGAIKKGSDGYELRFERSFEQPVETVWEFITDPDRLEQWLGVADVDLRVGGQFRLLEVGGQGIAGVIEELDPPWVLEYTWDSAEWSGGTVRYELSRTAEGAHLVFTHVHPFKTWDEYRFKSLAGWHTLLDLLGLALEGRPESWHIGRWQEHLDRYMAGANNGFRDA